MRAATDDLQKENENDRDEIGIAKKPPVHRSRQSPNKMSIISEPTLDGLLGNFKESSVPRPGKVVYWGGQRMTDDGLAAFGRKRDSTSTW